MSGPTNAIDQGALEDAAEKLLACVDVVLMTWRGQASGASEKRPKDDE